MPNVYNIGDVIESQVLGTIYGQTCMNVIHWLCKLNGQSTTNIAAEIQNGYTNNIRDVISASHRWTGFKIRKIAPGGVGDYETALFTGNQPTGSAGALPPQLCTLWAVKTDISVSPHGRGRIYHPAIPGSYWSDGAWVSLAITRNATAIAAVLNRFKLGGTSTVLTMIVRSDPTGTNSPVTNFIMRAQPAVQRSRRINF